MAHTQITRNCRGGCESLEKALSGRAEQEVGEEGRAGGGGARREPGEGSKEQGEVLRGQKGRP